MLPMCPSDLLLRFLWTSDEGVVAFKAASLHSQHGAASYRCAGDEETLSLMWRKSPWWIQCQGD
jgi:hypothetical protein